VVSGSRNIRIRMQVHNRALFADLQQSIRHQVTDDPNSFASDDSHSFVAHAANHRLASNEDDTPRSVDSRISERFLGRLYFPELKERRGVLQHEGIGFSSSEQRHSDQQQHGCETVTQRPARAGCSNPFQHSARIRTHPRPGATASAPARVDPGNLTKEVGECNTLLAMN
jgi:hypothetical protein